MTRWRENLIMKASAFIAAVAAFTATAILAWYQIANFDALWGSGSGAAAGYAQHYLVKQDAVLVARLVDLKEREAAGAELTLSERRSLEQLEAEFDAGATNLRWQLLDQEGGIIYGNTREDAYGVEADYCTDYSREAWRDGYEAGRGLVCWDEAVYNYSAAVNLGDYGDPVCDDRWMELLPQLAAQARDYPDREVYEVYGDTESDAFSAAADAPLCDGSCYTLVLRITDPDGDLYIYPPTIRACLEPNQFGFVFDPDGAEWTVDPDLAPAGEYADQTAPERATLLLWVDGALRVEDQYQQAFARMQEWRADREGNLALTLLLGAAGALLMVYLCCGAGHKKGVEGIYLNWFHRIPGDVLLFLLFLGGVGAVGLGVESAMRNYMDVPMYLQLINLGLGAAAASALGLGALITVCARYKARTLLRDTWTWKLCGWCWRAFLLVWGWLWGLADMMGRAVQAVPLVWKAVIGCMAYPIFTLATIRWAAGPWLLGTLLAAACLCTWAYQWKKIRRGAQEIIGGNPNYQIDTRRMFPDLRAHADELNNLGHAISTAVDERMKSEHFKAELITNVSHDLKTPLTSIINYVDLLKKADIQDPKALEYIEVLDRKSQRLKKLTEDLVEASKASTGNLTVNWERLDFKQLADQALAECGDRLEAQGLTVVRTLPEEPVWVDADGRHLWRVLDNLLTNCAKYALPGTRVYVELREDGGRAVLSVKNISRDALDIPAERLMERFVRGDESRNASGSGLGLSIAQSLTELQHGKFEITIDGDLFKAVVSLPLTGADGGVPPALRLFS